MTNRGAGSKIQSFRTAPMCAMIGGFTLALLALPLILGLAFLRSLPAPALVVPGVIVLLYLGIWVWGRPSRFELDPSGLTILWPLRRQHIPWRQMRHARTLRRDEFRSELGFAVRIGAGGLWGAFGWLWTTRRGMLDVYISRTDGVVLIERTPGRALLITPENPSEFARAVEVQTGASAA